MIWVRKQAWHWLALASCQCNSCGVANPIAHLHACPALQCVLDVHVKPFGKFSVTLPAAMEDAGIHKWVHTVHSTVGAHCAWRSPCMACLPPNSSTSSAQATDLNGCRLGQSAFAKALLTGAPPLCLACSFNLMT